MHMDIMHTTSSKSQYYSSMHTYYAYYIASLVCNSIQ